MLSGLEAVTQDSYLDGTRIICCRVVKQNDAHSCGWRVCYNAVMIVNKILRIDNETYEHLSDYTDTDLRLYRATAIEALINCIEDRQPNVPLAFVPPSPRPPPRAPPRRYPATTEQREYVHIDPIDLEADGEQAGDTQTQERTVEPEEQHNLNNDV